MKTIYPALLLFVLVINIVSAQQTYYVSPNGLNIYDGKSIPNAFQTIQHAVNNASPGDTVYILEGIYREEVTIGGSKNGLKLFAYQEDSVVLKGSDIRISWTAEGSYWKKAVDVQPQQVIVNGDYPLQQIGYPNADFRDNQSYPRYNNPVGSGLEDMGPGRFFWKDGTLYIWLKDGSNPNDHTIEVSQRRRILQIDGDNVHIKGLRFRHSNTNTFASQGAAVNLGNNSILENCDVQWCDFGGVSMGYLKTEAKAINCNVSNNGATGFNASASFNFLISGCKANNNNYRNFYAKWHAGGFKAAASAWGTIENSEFAWNIGAGVWFDYCKQMDAYRQDGQKPIIVRNNYIHHNSKTANENIAILIEVSEMTNLQNNLVINNNYGGIYISGSWDSNVTNNVVAYNNGFHGITTAGMPRGGARLTDNLVVNNIIYNNTTSNDITFLEENGTDIVNNISHHNLVYRDESSIAVKYGSTKYYNLDDWRNNTPHGESSINEDPLFADTLFHISTESPAIDAGTVWHSYLAEKDYDGNPRLVGERVDMGAYEGGLITHADRIVADNDSEVSLTVFPNPFYDSLSIEFKTSMPKEKIMIDLIDSQGSVIRELYVGNAGIEKHFLQVNASQMPVGNYFVRLRTSQYEKTSKIIRLSE